MKRNNSDDPVTFKVTDSARVFLIKGPVEPESENQKDEKKDEQ